MRGALPPGNLLRRGSTEPTSHPGDERLARAELRRQIGRLELELAHLTFEGFGRVDVPHRVGAAAAVPCLLDLGALERVRDALAGRAGEAAAALAARAAVEAANRELLRDLIESPGDHRWLRISRADVGEPGCGHWHSRPVLGPLGMLMGWWRVKISSGCPRPARLAAASWSRAPSRAGRSYQSRTRPDCPSRRPTRLTAVSSMLSSIEIAVFVSVGSCSIRG
jgi:hypothetical protein